VEQSAVPSRRRPFGVLLLTLLLLAYSALALVVALDVLGPVAGLARGLEDTGVLRGAHAVPAVAAGLAAVLLWFRHRWGWLLAMLLAGATLTVEIVVYFRGESAYAYMAVATVIAFYLNSADVRRYFAGDGEAPPVHGGRVPVRE
jgi:hypothetical protein